MLVISAISLSKRTLFARLLLAAGAAQIGLSAPPLRVLTPQDLFRLEKLDETTSSPDGKLLAFVLIRSKTTASIHMSDFMEGMDRADIWVIPVKSGPPTRITNGATDETKGPEQAMRVWPRAWQGRVSTASVLQSGLAIDSQIRPQGRLLKFDLSKHTE